jgi:hypothetical protein
MKLISFDIGIKNMAYCVFELSGNFPIITSWNNINLIQTDNIEKKCNCIMKNKKECNKKATYVNKNNYYCKTHVKKISSKVLEKPIKISKNINLKELREINDKYKLNVEFDKKKEEIIKEITNKIENDFFKRIIEKKNKKAQDYDLVDIGKKIKYNFNLIEDFNDVTNIIIENQISPIANRMKTIQGMVAQYFIMKFDSINIDFISSSNKLKYFENEGSSYKDNKKNGVYFCNKVINLNSNNYSSYVNYLDNFKKKDDLADCFLQGIWYFKFKINTCQELII